jgi:hypothetical protein
VESLPGFRYAPALSEPAPEDAWDGETGLVTDMVKRHDGNLRGPDAPVCGPPPMVETAMPMLAVLGALEKRIYCDKFITTGDPGEQRGGVAHVRRLGYPRRPSGRSGIRIRGAAAAPAVVAQGVWMFTPAWPATCPVRTPQR